MLSQLEFNGVVWLCSCLGCEVAQSCKKSLAGAQESLVKVEPMSSRDFVRLHKVVSGNDLSREMLTSVETLQDHKPEFPLDPAKTLHRWQ